jgi:hypothetical protein
MNFRNRLSLSPVAAEAFWWLIIAWLALDVLPGNVYLRLLPPRRPVGKAENVDTVLLDPRATIVAHVVDYISRRLPVRSACFHRAIAVDRMLSRRGITRIMHYGVLRDDGAIKAHVWITSAGTSVMGVADAEPYTEIAQFVDIG